MTVVAAGQVNTTAGIVPDLYVQIVPPQVVLFTGVPTNILGMVGTAQWGPVNSPVIGGSMSQFAENFGAIQNRKYDLGTQVAVAALQGAADFRWVRVTDGTDVAATVTAQGLTATSRYTGTLGNSIRVLLENGAAAGTYRVTVAMPGRASETFDNLAKGLTGNAIWVAIAQAINQGVAGQIGPSEIIVATAGASITAPTVPATFVLTGGTDGAGGVGATQLIGADTGTRTGMYALRGSGASVGVLVDCDTTTTWSEQASFALSEGIYMIVAGPAGDTVSAAITAKQNAGIDSYGIKVLHGDWVYWNDPVNGVTRIVSPQGFSAGLLAALSPEQSTLNKPMFGIVATQRTFSKRRYSAAELASLGGAGIDVITNPLPRGNVFGARIGRNSSTDARLRGDNYTRMTNYIAYTLNARMGLFIGELQSVRDGAGTLRNRARAALDSLGQAMLDAGMLDEFQTILDKSNNPDNQVALGNMRADFKARYLSVVERFFINVEGGQSVQVRRERIA